MRIITKYKYHREIRRLENAINSLRPFAEGDFDIKPNAEALAISTLANAQVAMLKDRATIAVQQEIPLSRIADLLCCAFEGGSNYWYLIKESHAPSTDELPFRTDEIRVFPHVDYPLNEGGYLIITTLEHDVHKGKKEWRLDLNAVKHGLRVMAALQPGHGGHHFPNFMAENEDAETGDVFLQCCLFGEIIYS